MTTRLLANYFFTNFLQGKFCLGVTLEGECKIAAGVDTATPKS